MTDYYVRLLDDGISIIEQFWAVEETVAHQASCRLSLALIMPNPAKT